MSDFQQNTHEPQHILHKYWGYSSFRSRQAEIVQSVLDGRDTLALLPTGGGKSVCFQVPALCKPGICIVISPLLALMHDQVENLKKRGIRAQMISSANSKRESDVILDNCVYGDTRFLYVSPERLSNELFLVRLAKMKVNLIAVDESHCISQWGYDFRPDYLRIAEVRSIHPTVPVLAVTASATPEVVEDIQQKLHFSKPNVIGISFERPNLVYIVREADDKEKMLIDSCKKMQGCGIVYCGTRARTKEVAGMLQARGITATYYHAGMDQAARKAAADRWFQNKVRVMCATNAFGMGIDKPDVRFVLHADLPPNPENYFQEAGRAGRDGKTAYAGLFWRKADLEKLDEFIDGRYPSRTVIQSVYQALCNGAQLAIGAGEYVQIPLDIKVLSEKTGVDTRSVFHSLELLERAGYIELNEFARGGSKLHIPVRKEQLYNFQVTHPDHDPFIRLLLRMYGGLFENYMGIREAEIAKASRLPLKSVEERLSLLDKLGLMAYEKKLGGASCTLLQPRVAEKNIVLPDAIYEDRRAADMLRAMAIKRFVQTEQCRSVQLLTYFGEQNPPSCGRCDVCKEKNTGSAQSKNESEALLRAEQLMAEKPITVHELIEALQLPKSQATRLIRWQVDEGVWELTAQNELKRKSLN